MMRQRITDVRRPGWTRTVALAVMLGGAAPLRAEPALDAPAYPMLVAEPAAGWSIGVHYGSFSREMKADGEVLELDGNRVVAEVGYSVAPFLQLAAQTGWAKAELDGREGENGLAWALIGRANLVEHVLRASPVTGRQEWAGAAVDFQYRYHESNQDQGDFDWTETLLVPNIYFFHNRRGDALRQEYEPSGLGLRAGLAFSSIDGDYDGLEITENRDFGFQLGGDVRWTSGWVARLRATLFGSGDRFIEIGTLFHF